MAIEPVITLTDSTVERSKFDRAEVTLRSDKSHCWNALLYFNGKGKGVEVPMYIPASRPDYEVKEAAAALGRESAARRHIDIPSLIMDGTLPFKDFVHGWIDQQAATDAFPNGIAYRLRLVTENLGNQRTSSKMVLDLADKKGSTYHSLSINVPGLDSNTRLRHYCEDVVAERLGAENRTTRHSDSPRVRRARGSDVAFDKMPEGITVHRQNGTRSCAVMISQANQPLIQFSLGTIPYEEAQGRLPQIREFMRQEIEDNGGTSLSAVKAYAHTLGNGHHNGAAPDANGLAGHNGLQYSESTNGFSAGLAKPPRLRVADREIRYPNTGGLMLYAPARGGYEPVVKAYVNHTGNKENGYRFNVTLVPPDGNQRTQAWVERHFQVPPEARLDDKQAAQLLFNLREYVYARLGNYFSEGHMPEMQGDNGTTRCTRHGRDMLDDELEHRLNAKFVVGMLADGHANPFDRTLSPTVIDDHGGRFSHRNASAWTGVLEVGQVEWPQPANRHFSFGPVQEHVINHQVFYECDVTLSAQDGYGAGERQFSRLVRVPHRDSLVALAQAINEAYPPGMEPPLWETARRLDRILADSPQLQVVARRATSTNTAG